MLVNDVGHVSTQNAPNTIKMVRIRLAHFSHFSREREMVLRDISREKSGARNCEKNEPNSSLFEAQFDQNMGNF